MPVEYSCRKDEKAQITQCAVIATNAGQFEITAAGTYYLLFRAGGASYGSIGIVLDNFSIKAVN